MLLICLKFDHYLWGYFSFMCHIIITYFFYSMVIWMVKVVVVWYNSLIQYEVNHNYVECHIFKPSACYALGFLVLPHVIQTINVVCLSHFTNVFWLLKFISISFPLVKTIQEKAYAAETCMTYLWYKLISLLSASDWSKLYW